MARTVYNWRTTGLLIPWFNNNLLIPWFNDKIYLFDDGKLSPVHDQWARVFIYSILNKTMLIVATVVIIIKSEQQQQQGW